MIRLEVSTRLDFLHSFGRPSAFGSIFVSGLGMLQNFTCFVFFLHGSVPVFHQEFATATTASSVVRVVSDGVYLSTEDHRTFCTYVAFYHFYTMLF